MESAITGYFIDVVHLYFITMVGIFLLAWFAKEKVTMIFGGLLVLSMNFAWFGLTGVMHLGDRWLYDASRIGPGWGLTFFVFLTFGVLMRAATNATFDDEGTVSTDPTDITNPTNLVNTMNPGSPMNRLNH